MQTEVRTVPRLEFIPVPDSATQPCLAPSVPLNPEGQFWFHQLPGYTIEVLGRLEECNEQLESIRRLMELGNEGEDSESNKDD